MSGKRKSSVLEDDDDGNLNQMCEHKESDILYRIDQKLTLVTGMLIKHDLLLADLGEQINQIKPPVKLTGSTDHIRSVMPLMSRETVEDFDRNLENSTVLNEFKIFVSKIGGQTPSENLKRVFSKIFSNTFAAQSTWMGRKDHFSIEKLKLIQIIKEIILTDHPGYQEHNFNQEGAQWFRLGTQRKLREEKQSKIKVELK